MSGQREKRPESGRKPRARAIFRHLYSQRDWSDRRWRAGRGLTVASSASVHLSLRILGFTLWRQRWAHCWPVRPGISSATEAQRLPYLACVHGVGGVSGESRPQARARATTGWKEAYLEAREHLILRFGPRSTLEVDVIGHERWVWGRERGEGRAMRCVFCGVARGEASVMTFFARSAWGTSLEIFFSPNRNLPGVRFSQIAHHQPAAAREICCSAEGERRVVC